MIDSALARRLVIASRKGREWDARRDQLIQEAYEKGGTQVEIAKLTGFSQPSISAIVNRE